MAEGLFTGRHNVRRAIRPVNMRRTRAFGAELTSSSAITRHTRVKLSAQTCSSCSGASWSCSCARRVSSFNTAAPCVAS